MLWYQLVPLVPSPGFVTDIQKTLVHFFWDKKMHWVMAQVLSLPIEEGGQLLVVIHTQVATFCLQTLQRCLYVEHPPRWYRQWAMKGVITADSLPLFRSYVRVQVSLEKEHVVSTNTLDVFRE
eukprot:g36801.t1